ncbi:hypothetical protein [Granulicoccus phenolivorans]|uniref:hypothetical protein n=1 Tax=Granulicoccus phenolivorans TaxID=266854 RepID=UPI0004216363|nr:hypothetical protein [Granulicoccus phenolivorans]
MSDTFVALLTSADGGLILDAADYTQRVLLQGRAEPWSDATAYANHLRQAQALLKPAVALLPLDRLMRTQLATDQALREAMVAKSRRGYAARALLSDETLKELARAQVRTATQTQREPVLLQLPAPKVLLQLAAAAVRPGAGDEFDDDDAENVAMYFADWSRGFAEAPVAGVIFDERGGVASAESWGPILNTARHYGWPVGLRGVDRVRFLEPEVTLPVISAAEFDTATLPTAVALVEVPVDAVPEDVLARLATLRAA